MVLRLQVSKNVDLSSFKEKKSAIRGFSFRYLLDVFISVLVSDGTL